MVVLYHDMVSHRQYRHVTRAQIVGVLHLLLVLGRLSLGDVRRPLPFRCEVAAVCRNGVSYRSAEDHLSWRAAVTPRSVAVLQDAAFPQLVVQLYGALIPSQHLLSSFFADFTAASARPLDCG